MKGIVLAGGSGNRLYPMTSVLSKQLQPIYDKPMIFYPLSTLMLMGIKDILIISTAFDLPFIKRLLGDGSDLGLCLSYKVQSEPKGISQAFIIGEDFIRNDDVTLILGDNLFYGEIGFMKSAVIEQAIKKDLFKARIFGYSLHRPERFGVVEIDQNTSEVLSVEEKPDNPRSNYAIPGLYIFDDTVAKRAKAIKPSARGELEITDLMESYIEEKKLSGTVIGRGVSWIDAGTPDSLIEAGILVSLTEKRQGLKIACLHEIALRKRYITKDDLLISVSRMPNSPYKEYLGKLL